MTSSRRVSLSGPVHICCFLARWNTATALVLPTTPEGEGSGHPASSLLRWLVEPSLSLSFSCAALLEADKGGPGAPQPQSPDELLQSLPAEVLCGQEPQLVHHLDLKVIGGLEVSGHRLRSQYPVPSREQLEQDLHSDSSIQGALASQRALLAVSEGGSLH